MSRSKKGKQPDISIELVGLGLKLKLSKATGVKLDKNMIHFDQLNDGSWRLIYNSNLIPDIKSLESLRIVRKRDNDNDGE